MLDKAASVNAFCFMVGEAATRGAGRLNRSYMYTAVTLHLTVKCWPADGLKLNHEVLTFSQKCILKTLLQKNV